MSSQEIATRQEIGGLAAFAADNDAVMMAGDSIFFKKGTWYRGENAFDTRGLTFVANIAEAYTGWTRWEGKRPTEHKYQRLVDYTREVPRAALGDLDRNAWEADDRGMPHDPWQISDRIVLRSAERPDELFTFISSSKGGRNALAKLMKKVARSPQAKEGRYPIIELDADTYDHEKYGVVHYPGAHGGWLGSLGQARGASVSI